MKTTEELKQEIIELKQQLESTTIALSRVYSTTIAKDRQKLQKQILGMTIELADLQRSESAYDWSDNLALHLQVFANENRI
jgi:hypothetical protein